MKRLGEINHELSIQLASAGLTSLTLDGDLRVAQMGPGADKLLGIARECIGQLATEMVSNLLRVELAADAAEASGAGGACEREVRGERGRWFKRRLQWFGATGDFEERFVVVFAEITESKIDADRLLGRVRHQATIADLGLQALEEVDIQALLDEIVNEVRDTLHVDCCELLELRPDARELLLRAGVGWESGQVGSATIDRECGSEADRSLESGDAVVVRDLDAEAHVSGSARLSAHGMRSGLSCAVRGPGGVYGVLGAYTRKPGEFGDEDVRFLRTAAALVSSAVGRHLSRQRLELERRVSRLLAQAATLEAAARGVHEVFAEVCGTALGELWTPSGADGEYRCTVATISQGAEIDPDLLSSFLDRTFRGDEGHIGRVSESGRALWVSPGESESCFLRRDAAMRLGFTSGLAFPIRFRQEVLGVVALYSRDYLMSDAVLLRALETIGITAGNFIRRIEAEGAVAEGELRKAEVLEASPDAVVSMDASGRILEFNTSAERMFELRREEVLGLDMADTIIPERLRGRYRQAVDRHLASHTVGMRVERRVLIAQRAEGSEFPVEVSIARVDRGGKPSFTAFLRDVTSRMEWEAALAEREERYRGFFESVGVSLWEQDFSVVNKNIERLRSEGVTDFANYFEQHPDFVAWAASEVRVIDANPESVRLFEAPNKEALLKGLEQLFLPETHDSFVGQLVSLATGERYRAAAAECQTLGGRRLTVMLSIRFYFGPEPNQATALVSVMDTSELEAARRELLEASEQKDSFIAYLGHELRNPLAAIQNATDAFTGPAGGGDERGHAVEILQRQTQHMKRLIDGLLDVSRIVRGKITLERAPFDLREVVRSVLSDCEHRVTSSALSVQVDVGDDALVVNGDRVRLSQVVENLLSNALKYTEPPGEVHLRLAVAGSMAMLEVTDTGVGIPIEDLAELFEPFRQLEPRDGRSEGGLGIGLALVKSLVELHGGQVSAESQGAGHGSRFVVELPMYSGPIRQPDSRATVEPSHGRRILLVEDDKDVADSLAMLLERRGHQVRVVATGEGALRQLDRDQPDVVLCDLRLQGALSGLDVARKARERQSSGGPYLIAMTGFGRPEDEERSLEAGFDHHLTKPVELKRLLRVLAEEC